MKREQNTQNSQKPQPNQLHMKISMPIGDTRQGKQQALPAALVTPFLAVWPCFGHPIGNPIVFPLARRLGLLRRTPRAPP